MSFITFSGFLNWVFKHNKATKPWMEMNLKSLLLWAPAEISYSPCYCLSREELQTYQMWSLGFRLGLKCLTEVLASWNAALQSPCSKEIKDRISNEGGGFLASPRCAGRVLHYCCICPSSTAQNTCEPRALWALWPQEVSKCLLGYLLPASTWQVCLLLLTLCSNAPFYCFLGYVSECFVDSRQGIGRWYHVCIICPTPAKPAATLTT